jgi:hypothetical protein
MLFQVVKFTLNKEKKLLKLSVLGTVFLEEGSISVAKAQK